LKNKQIRDDEEYANRKPNKSSNRAARDVEYAKKMKNKQTRADEEYAKTKKQNRDA